MDEVFPAALQLLVARGEAGELLDRQADEGGYRSRQPDASMDVIRNRLARLAAAQDNAAAWYPVTISAARPWPARSSS